jgi:hypothetical protein
MDPTRKKVEARLGRLEQEGKEGDNPQVYGSIVVPFDMKRLSNSQGAEGIGSQVDTIKIIAAKCFWCKKANK